jgi:hypothetical protein
MLRLNNLLHRNLAADICVLCFAYSILLLAHRHLQGIGLNLIASLVCCINFMIFWLYQQFIFRLRVSAIAPTNLT